MSQLVWNVRSTYSEGSKDPGGIRGSLCGIGGSRRLLALDQRPIVGVRHRDFGQRSWEEESARAGGWLCHMRLVGWQCCDHLQIFLAVSLAGIFSATPLSAFTQHSLKLQQLSGWLSLSQPNRPKSQMDNRTALGFLLRDHQSRQKSTSSDKCSGECLRSTNSTSEKLAKGCNRTQGLGRREGQRDR
jgi:hypothetical protein